MDNLFNDLRCKVHLTWSAQDHKEVVVTSPDDVYRIVRDEMVDSDREMLISILLTAHGAVIGIETVGVGGLSSCSVVPRELFKSAILANANSIVLCHNHPSNDLTASVEDGEITGKLQEAGRLLGIMVLDHLIITNEGYTSIINGETRRILSRTSRKRKY